MLLNPTEKYINYIENSKHYLNCPKYMFNYDLDCMYRQGVGDGKAVENVEFYLKKYDYPSPNETAKEFVDFRNSISLKDFDNLNINPYIKETPLHIINFSNRINKWVEARKEYYPFTDILKSFPDYPFKY